MNNNDDNLPTSSVNPEVSLPPITPSPDRRGLFGLAGLIVVIFLIVFLGNPAMRNQVIGLMKSPTPTPPVEVASVEPMTEFATPTPLPGPVEERTATWLGQPKLIKEDLKLLLYTPDPTDTTGTKVQYYQVGTDQGNDVILGVAPSVDPSGNRYLLFLKRDGNYEILMRHYYETIIAYNDSLVAPTVKKNTTIIYPAIIAPKELTVKNTKLSIRPSESRFFWTDYTSEKAFKVEAFETTSFGQLYSVVDQHDKDVKLQVYVLQLADGSASMYQHDPAFVGDDGIPKVTWLDGSTNADPYRWNSFGIAGGCGTYAFVAVDTTNPELVEIGKTSTGEAVYEYKNPSNSIAKKYYAALNGSYYNYNQETGESQQISISFDEYLKKHAIFVYKDTLGRSIVFDSQKYGLAVECGKPVIYLYPQKTTPVSVKVDADISASDPVYGSGWNVMAHPDGTLQTADGTEYHSLFWEGKGHDYPEITSGFVVKHDDVEKTLREHLAKLGLTAHEGAEFLDYWLPKMPNTPYVRLSWLGTQQMNRLAPLAISPQPNTVIRIFLDFAGLEKPIDLKPQALSALPRKGFTVVEWGGLLVK